MHAEEHLLREILRARAILDCARDQREHEILVSIDEDLERSLVTRTAAFHELALVEIHPLR